MMDNKGMYFNYLDDTNKLLNIFCFPYAGGGASVFQSWEHQFGNSVNVYPAHYPGHEDRLMEIPVCSIDQIVKEIYDEIHDNQLDDKPFILFGHSLGSRVAYELGIRFEETGQKNFQGLISSGQHAPNIMEKHPIHHLPDSDFFHELSKYNRTPVEIFENKEYWKIFEPPLRADFRMADTYIDQKHRKLHVPILVLCGSLDYEITDEDILEWEKYTTSNISTAIIEGGHLFIDTNMIDVIGRIREFIKKELHL